MLDLTLNEPRVSIGLTCEVAFTFTDRKAKLHPDEAAEFITREGIGYVLGYIRGALADLTREVGLPAVMIPTGIPDTGMWDQISHALREDA
ncbi:Uncharacterised protein [Mycobacteroides abscessus subsp. abscessus]|nr:Uncharacterised protein [Mycobacteroides abscessus subsp. abscessus]